MKIKRLIKNSFLGVLILSLSVGVISCNDSGDKKSSFSVKVITPKKGNVIISGEDTLHTVGKLPELGTHRKYYALTNTQLEEKTAADFDGKYVVMNIFPSLDTRVCAQSVRVFNEKAAGLENTVVLCISMDLPFAHKRFCEAEGIENVIPLSAFRSDFGYDFGVEIADGKLQGLLSRAVIVVNPKGNIVYTEQVPILSEEPNYDEALKSISSASAEK